MAEIYENTIGDTDTVDEIKLAQIFSYVKKSKEVSCTVKHDFIKNLAGTRSFKYGLSSTDNTIEIYTINECNLTKYCKLSGHRSSITGLVFNSQDENILYSCSEDCLIKAWDTRASGSCVMEYRDENVEDLKPYHCLDISSNNKLLCGGTELVNDDAFIVFFDQRQSKPLGGYWNSHMDDISQVRFHKTRSDRIATGSLDSLLNIFDLTNMTEDEALTYSLNVDNSVGLIRWLDDVTVACITQSNDLQLWNAESGDLVTSFTRDQIASAIKRSREDDLYVVDIYKTNEDKIKILAGSNSENSYCLRSVEVNGTKLKPAELFVSNNQIVRCCHYNPDKKILVTGGEAGILTLWNTVVGSEMNQNTDQQTICTSLSKKGKNRPKPY